MELDAASLAVPPLDQRDDERARRLDDFITTGLVDLPSTVRRARIPSPALARTKVRSYLMLTQLTTHKLCAFLPQCPCRLAL